MQQQQLTVHFILIVLKHSLITTFLQVPTARSATATSLQHTCPAAEVRETPLSPFFDPFQKEGKSYSRAKDIFLHWCHAHFVFSINESWYKEDIKPNITWIHISWYWSPGLCCVEYQWRFLFLLQDVLPASWGNISLALIKIEEKMIQCWPNL